MLRYSIALLAMIMAATGAHAHLASDSYLRIEIGDNGAVSGQWDIALRDLDVAVGLDTDQDGNITWGPTSRPVPQWTRPGVTAVKTLGRQGFSH